jgi:mRNA interferase MazF
MTKDFDGWNEQKKLINARTEATFYHEREVRWCQLGLNVGFEQDGTGTERARPVVILKAFSRSVCLVVPLTTSRKHNPYHFPIGEIASNKAFAIISQLRLIDTKRLDRKIAVLDTDTFEGMRKAVKEIL